MHEMLAKLLHRLLLEALDNRDDFPRILFREALQLAESVPVLRQSDRYDRQTLDRRCISEQIPDRPAQFIAIV